MTGIDNDRSDGARRRASMREVADRAGVAISSVSRVLSGHPDVSPRMRDKVLAAVRAFEYEPDFLAQSLRRGETRSIGFVVGDIANPVMADIAGGAEAVLRGSDYSMLLMGSESRPELDAAHIRFFTTRRVDGMILTLSSEREANTLAALRSVDVPIVLVDRTLPPEICASAVVCDHGPGVKAATRHLLELGHRRIALVTGPLDIRPIEARLQAMREEIGSSGLDAELYTSTGSLDAAHGEAGTLSLLRRMDAPTAIVSGGNQLLAGCLRAIAREGLKVGQDVSLISCDEVPLVEFHHPPIAVVTRDTRAMGREAAALMLRRLHGVAGPEDVIMPTDYIARASCAPPPAIAFAS